MVFPCSYTWFQKHSVPSLHLHIFILYNMFYSFCIYNMFYPLMYKYARVLFLLTIIISEIINFASYSYRRTYYINGLMRTALSTCSCGVLYIVQLLCLKKHTIFFHIKMQKERILQSSNSSILPASWESVHNYIFKLLP